MAARIDLYSKSYQSFTSDVRHRFRHDVYGEDIGQHSWTMADELRSFAAAANYNRATRLLEIGCGAGGPALFLARTLGLQVTGMDINADGVAAANAAAAAAGLGERATFVCGDGGLQFPFDAEAFDAVLLIDAINHIPDRAGLLREILRVLRAGGSLLYTDSGIVTGIISNEDIAARSPHGHFEFAPAGSNEALLAIAGFRLHAQFDASANLIGVSGRRVAAQEKWHKELAELEGLEALEHSQAFNRAVHEISRAGKLSRFAFLAHKQS